jgi:Na+/H+ antiporter NhaD/arsenite permease-like protein
MAIYRVPAGLRGLGMASLALGFLGLAFVWLVPFGGVLSLAGLLLGLIGWVLSRAGSDSRRWSIAGAALSVVALILDIVVGTGGLESARLPWMNW